MNAKLKKRLAELLPPMAASLDPSFEADPMFASHANLVAVRRRVPSRQWQFVALAFSGLGERFFVEVAYSPLENFPVDRIPIDPNGPPSNGVLRFRASELWCRPNKSGGWLILNPNTNPLSDSIAPPEGIFETPEAAMDDVKGRMVKWILPYFVKLKTNG